MDKKIIKNSENRFLEIMKKNETIPTWLIECLENNKVVVLYGNGNQGVICEETLVDALGFCVECFAKSDEYKDVPNRYSQLPSYLISELPYNKTECQIVIALNNKDSMQVYDDLKEKGYENVFKCEDWEPVNLALREIRFQALMEDYQIKVDKNIDVFTCRSFKFTNPYKENHNFLTFFLGEFGELVAPHILNDFTMLRTEGPYCYHNVDIIGGDVVLDLGANIGLFSASAAAKGCKVFSFEPIKFVANYLRKTAKLNSGNIEVIEAAVCDVDGKVEFSKVPDDFHDIGESSLIARPENFERVWVPAMTIDQFVLDKGLEKVDFIKADIEGAERNMLMGAQETLAKFAPKLAICTYHLPDDKEVLTELIMKANPNYIIEYKWEKLYAHVPKEI